MSTGSRAVHITVLPGDGIGPEVALAGRRVLEAVAPSAGLDITFDEAPFGGCAIDEAGTPLPDETLRKCQAADAVLLGAVGGPKWDTLPGDKRPEKGLLGIRKALGLFANLRPVRLPAPLAAGSPLRDRVIGDGVDLIIVRELNGGAYYGAKIRSEDGRRAVDETVYTAEEVQRVARVAFKLAQGRSGRLTSVDKANVLETSRLWRENVLDVAKEFPNVELDHLYVDNCAMQLVANPRRFDVMVTENLFGDILSDLGGVICGSLGMLPSASLGEGGKGLYEPVHGSAPDIAGQGIANPIGTILSVAMMLRLTFDKPAAANRIENAVERVLADGYRTRDIAFTADTGGMAGSDAGASQARARLVGTEEMTRRIIEAL